MKIHYISHHSILEYDEVQLLLDLGHEVFSNGAYLDPDGHISHPRPGLRGAKFYSNYAELARTTPKTDMPKELIDPFDLIIVMHSPDVLIQNWPKLKDKPVIWRSIGQSTPQIEAKLKPLKKDGLKIMRYSPKERNLEGYIGEDAMIRFYKDEKVYDGWLGDTEDVVNFSQSLLGRRDFCHYDEIMSVIETFDGKVYGPGNEDLGKHFGGEVPYEQQLEIMRQSRVMVYGGTWPAPYTLGFIEAMMMGLPIVSISKKTAHVKEFQPIDFFEVDEILGKVSGVVCDNTEEMISQTRKLVENPNHAKNLSERQRELAVEMFGKKNISAQWKEMLDGIRG